MKSGVAFTLPALFEWGWEAEKDEMGENEVDEGGPPEKKGRRGSSGERGPERVCGWGWPPLELRSYANVGVCWTEDEPGG